MRVLLLAAISGLSVLAACVPRAPAPEPAPPTPVPARPATRPAPVAPPSSDWRDWALTPGTWRYAAAPGGSTATFGRGGNDWSLRLTCRTATRQVTIEKVGHSGTALTVRTTTLTRSVPARDMAHADGVPPFTIDATLPADDRLLDAMGFSRGRFVVEGGVTGALVIPAWAEILRVIEDCRG